MSKKAAKNNTCVNGENKMKLSKDLCKVIAEIEHLIGPNVITPIHMTDGTM